MSILLDGGNQICGPKVGVKVRETPSNHSIKFGLIVICRIVVALPTVSSVTGSRRSLPKSSGPTCGAVSSVNGGSGFMRSKSSSDKSCDEG